VKNQQAAKKSEGEKKKEVTGKSISARTIPNEGSQVYKVGCYLYSMSLPTSNDYSGAGNY
jgi:hypothetical protein